ncbi:endonuclease V [Streptomyces durbertensis]|uniref:Endonuclease V n=1 Tax=Streptomyces durbertensis TaxID=2448886 RepID=A0ABR6EI25_9ACTN|nr:endonuclease V [Streptomyces durbertensis]MBB1244975.1 endonuclease V [Streptomyces durbertensis]
MRTNAEHRTPADEAEAVATQLRLRDLVEPTDSSPTPGEPGTLVGGVDVAYDDRRGLVAAAAVLLDAATLTTVEEATACGPVPFPYRPGLLAFRELPSVLEALERLTHTPALLVCDGYGIAHPRRFGLASHLGVLTGLPALGVAKNPFGFSHGPLAPERGAAAELRDPATGEVVGAALRTSAGVKPVYVSPGHRVSLPAACAHVLRLAGRFRQPETTRRADRLCRATLAAALES